MLQGVNEKTGLGLFKVNNKDIRMTWIGIVLVAMNSMQHSIQYTSLNSWSNETTSFYWKNNRAESYNHVQVVSIELWKVYKFLRIHQQNGLLFRYILIIWSNTALVFVIFSPSPWFMCKWILDNCQYMERLKLL